MHVVSMLHDGKRVAVYTGILHGTRVLFWFWWRMVCCADVSCSRFEIDQRSVLTAKDVRRQLRQVLPVVQLPTHSDDKVIVAILVKRGVSGSRKAT